MANTLKNKHVVFPSTTACLQSCGLIPMHCSRSFGRPALFSGLSLLCSKCVDPTDASDSTISSRTLLKGLPGCNLYDVAPYLIPYTTFRQHVIALSAQALTAIKHLREYWFQRWARLSMAYLDKKLNTRLRPSFASTVEPAIHKSAPSTTINLIPFLHIAKGPCLATFLNRIHMKNPVTTYCVIVLLPQ